MKITRHFVVVLLLMGLVLTSSAFSQNQQDDASLNTNSTTPSISYEELLEKIADLEQRLGALEKEVHGPIDDLTSLVDRIIEQRTAMYEEGALRYTIYNNVGGYGLTEKLTSLGTKAFYFPDEHLILLQANTDTQPAWNFHLGRGRFSVSDREVRNAFHEAAEVIYSSVLDWFDLRVVYEELRPEILIQFFISSYEVGTWHEHEFTLLGE